MATLFFSPATSPAVAAALAEEGDAAYARCKKLVPPNWAAELKVDRDTCWAAKPVIERHVQSAPDAWQAAVRREALAQQQRRARQVKAKAEEGLPRCDGCGLLMVQLKWCPCHLKRYCSKDCQKRDFPAHKAECKKARGIA